MQDLENYICSLLRVDNPIAFIDTVRLVEEVSEVINLVIAKVSPLSFILPKTAFCYYEYITANGAFELPFPIWYAE